MGASHAFTRSQLIGSLLDDVTKAQSSFQASQLAAWAELAPNVNPPAAGQLMSVSEVELRLDVRPERLSWLQTIWFALHPDKRQLDPRYELCRADERRAIRLTLKLTKNGDRYVVSPE